MADEYSFHAYQSQAPTPEAELGSFDPLCVLKIYQTKDRIWWLRVRWFDASREDLTAERAGDFIDQGHQDLIETYRFRLYRKMKNSKRLGAEWRRKMLSEMRRQDVNGADHEDEEEEDEEVEQVEEEPEDGEVEEEKKMEKRLWTIAKRRMAAAKQMATKKAREALERSMTATTRVGRQSGRRQGQVRTGIIRRTLILSRRRR